MKKQFLIAMAMIYFFSSPLFSQGIEPCGTIERTDEEMEILPWYGNNDYLDSVNNEVKSIMDRDKSPVENRSGNNCNDIESDWMVPVRFWI